MGMQPFQDCGNISLEQVIDHSPGSVRLEIADFLRQVVGRSDEMHMVFQGDLAEQRHPLLLVQETPGIAQNIDRLRPREDREPADDGAGEEMRITLLAETVAATAHGHTFGMEDDAERRCGIPMRSMGTRNYCEIGATRSIFAARMKSFSDRPPIACVQTSIIALR